MSVLYYVNLEQLYLKDMLAFVVNHCYNLLHHFLKNKMYSHCSIINEG
jgi:hypothetical protein